MTHEGLKHQMRVVKYSSPYPAERIYISDKNFTVRLLAMINRAMNDLGYNTHDEKFKALYEFIGEHGEPCLFAEKYKRQSQEEEKS